MSKVIKEKFENIYDKKVFEGWETTREFESIYDKKNLIGWDKTNNEEVSSFSAREENKIKKSRLKMERSRSEKVGIFLATWFFWLGADLFWEKEFKYGLWKAFCHLQFMMPLLAFVVYEFYGLAMHWSIESLNPGIFIDVLLGVCALVTIICIYWDIKSVKNWKTIGASA